MLCYAMLPHRPRPGHDVHHHRRLPGLVLQIAGRCVHIRRHPVGRRPVSLVDVPVHAQRGLHPGLDLLQQIQAPRPAPVGAGVPPAEGGAVDDEDVRVGGDLGPLCLQGRTAVRHEGPAAELWGPGGAVEAEVAEVRESDGLILEVVAKILPHQQAPDSPRVPVHPPPALLQVLLIEAEVVVAGDNHLVLVGLGAQPVCNTLNLLLRPTQRKIPGVYQDVPLWDHQVIQIPPVGV
mmetsp:Transcript_20603/g.52403  ORF Transcript_20603/g.52403 Transcript_20603/m.52403 type:complete len:235 (-) Transcript_20603:243-947(-)